MKKLLFLILFIPALTFGETICIDIPDEWRTTIEDSVISLDDWIYKALEGKNNSCEGRIIKKEVAISIEENEEIPAGRQAIINKHLNRPGYKNRKTRENERER